MAVIAVLGTFDTKGIEHAYLAEQIKHQGEEVLLIDVGTGGPPLLEPHIDRQSVARAASIDLADVLRAHDRGQCVQVMTKAAPVLLESLAKQGRIHGVISMGGGGGTSIATAAMRALPVGFPKLMVSTLASGNTAHYLRGKDIAMMNSIVDIAGLNRVSRMIFAQAAGAICGMVRAQESVRATLTQQRPIVVASMFGNTTPCVQHAAQCLEQAGFEVLIFHATGSGGEAMEALIDSGLVAGVLDITTTELADELVGGVLSAGADRLEAAGRAGVPAVVVPGCLDMVNFGEPHTIAPPFDGRRFYAHNPQVTLMGTTPEECRQLGEWIARKVNVYTAPVTVLIPERGFSLISEEGQPFHDPAADEALTRALETGLAPHVPVQKWNNAINDPAFAEACAHALLRSMSTLYQNQTVD